MTRFSRVHVGRWIAASNMSREDFPRTPQAFLARRLVTVLDGGLGLNILPDSWAFSKPAGDQQANLPITLKVAAITFSLYLIAFCLPLYGLHAATDGAIGNTGLARLQIYGALWAGWATISSRVTSESIQTILVDKVIPALSEPAARRAYRDMRLRFRRRLVRATSWTLGSASAVLAVLLVRTDVAASKATIAELVWWGVGWAILFTTSANVVNTSRVYLLLAAALEPQRLYPIDPARSTIVLDLNAVAQRMLLFWLGISVSIACIVPFALRASPTKTSYESVAAWAASVFKDAFVLDATHNNFVVVEMVATSIFSIGVGTIVFLRHETLVRRAVRNARSATLCALEQLVAQPMRNLRRLDEDERKRLKDLKDLRGSVVTAGSYRSLLVSGLSLVLPFVPLISLLLSKLGSHAP